MTVCGAGRSIWLCVHSGLFCFEEEVGMKQEEAEGLEFSGLPGP